MKFYFLDSMNNCVNWHWFIGRKLRFESSFFYFPLQKTSDD